MKKTIRFENIAKQRQSIVAEHIRSTPTSDGLKTLKKDLSRDVKLGDSTKPGAGTEELDTWIENVTGNNQLQNPEQRAAQKIAKAIIPSYSQHHSYVIPKICSNLGFVGDNTSIMVLNEPDDCVSEKVYFYDTSNKLKFKHTIDHFSLVAVEDIPLAHGQAIKMNDRVSVPTKITVEFEVNPEDGFSEDTAIVTIENDITLSNGKGLVETLMTEDKPELTVTFARMLHYAKTIEYYETLIDQYIQHVEEGNNPGKDTKLEIAYQAKAELTGKDMTWQTDNDSKTCYSSTKDGSQITKFNGFKSVLNSEENKETLMHNVNGTALTAITRILNHIRKWFSGQEASKSLLSEKAGFFKPHGEALVTLANDNENPGIKASPAA